MAGSKFGSVWYPLGRWRYSYASEGAGKGVECSRALSADSDVCIIACTAMESFRDSWADCKGAKFTWPDGKLSMTPLHRRWMSLKVCRRLWQNSYCPWLRSRKIDILTQWQIPEDMLGVLILSPNSCAIYWCFQSPLVGEKKKYAQAKLPL